VARTVLRGAGSSNAPRLPGGARPPDGDGRPVHLLAAMDHTDTVVLTQLEVDGKTNEISRFQPLLADLDLTGVVVTADAMHTQREAAEFLVTQKQADYLLIVKGNQPGLHAQLRALPWRDIPVLDRAATGATAGSSSAP
jgi:Transposase DDE domain